MKRSEAIENARQVAATDPYAYTCLALHGVITDLLEHIESTIPAPDYNPFEWPPSSHYTPVSAPDYDPDDVAFGEELPSDEPSSNSGQLPRLVPVERERPTLDQMPDGEPHRCYESVAKPDEANQVVLARLNGNAVSVSARGTEYGFSRGPASNYTVLDAEPQQQTVNDLRPGDVVKVDGMWMLCTSQFNFVMLGGTHSGYFRSPRRDTPIGQVYRFEV